MWGFILFVSTMFSIGGTALEEDSVTLSVTPDVFNLTEIPETVDVTMTNNTQDTLSAGLYYWIEKFENDEWKKISPEQSSEEATYKFSPSVFYTYEKSLFRDEIHYTAGKYRIAKYYFKSGLQKTKERYSVYAEFDVK